MGLGRRVGGRRDEPLPGVIPHPVYIVLPESDTQAPDGRWGGGGGVCINMHACRL